MKERQQSTSPTKMRLIQKVFTLVLTFPMKHFNIFQSWFYVSTLYRKRTKPCG